MEIAIRWKRKPYLKWGVLSAGAILLLQTSLPLQAEIRAIEAYQLWGSPVASLTARCRFEPTCSAYALEVLHKDGFWQGNWKIVKRLTLCSPVGFLLDALS